MTREAAAAVVNAGAQSKTFPPLDPATFGPQLVWLALTFGLLFLLVQRVILPRIEEVMKGRRDRISADENRSEELKGDTQSALADHERAIAEAKAEAAAITESMRQELLRELDRESSGHEAEIAAKLVEADKRIAASKAKAIAAIHDVAPDIANAVVAKAHRYHGNRRGFAAGAAICGRIRHPMPELTPPFPPARSGRRPPRCRPAHEF